MENSFLKQAADFLKNKKSARRWLVLFVCLAVAVTTGTFAALKLNGQAMTKKSLACGFEVHKHTDDCYETAANGEKTLVCGYADYVVHTHTAECLDENGELVCRLPEVEEHKHTESCFETQRVLTCTEEESGGHTHGDSCYQVEQTLSCGKEESAGHTHSDVCYDAEGNLICGMEESESHTHSAECYQEERILVCGKEESSGHTHSDACYTEEKVATCGKLELHTHDEKCYATPEDAKDNDGDGKADGRPVCGIPELVKHEHDENCFVDVQGTADEQKSGLFTTTSEDPEPGKTAADGNEPKEAVSDGSEAAPENNIADEADTLQKIYEDAGVRVTAEYTAEANIPENAQLQVKTVTEESDPEHFAQRREEALEATGQTEAGNMLLYNIGFFVDGEEIEPAAPVTITIQPLKDGFAEGSPVTVVHFGENGAETLDGTAVDEDGNTSFTSDSFSDYALMLLDDDGDSTGDDKPEGDMSGLLRGVTIKDNKGEEVKDGKLFVGEEYTIYLKFTEGGMDGNQFTWDENGQMTYQIPKSFRVDPRSNVDLVIDGVVIGKYSVDENGRLTIELTEEGKTKLENSNNYTLSFDMEATAQQTEGGADEDVHFGDAGDDFHFVVTDQPQISVEKLSNYDSDTRILDYTVHTTVDHGPIHDVVVSDTLTPPETPGITLEMVSAGEKPEIKVTVMRNGEPVELTEKDYELVPVAPDPTNPYAPQIFQVKLKEESEYNPLKTGDELFVNYQYQAEFDQSAADRFFGQVVNEATVTGSMPMMDPQTGEETEVLVEEKRGSYAEVYWDTNGDGVVSKAQHYSEATGLLHYTLYAAVAPNAEYSPFFINDRATVEYDGKTWIVQGFDAAHCLNLEVYAQNIANWPIESIPAGAGGKKLTGYDYNDAVAGNVPDYSPSSMDNYIYRMYADAKTSAGDLYIYFGMDDEHPQGNWKYDSGRLITVEYDLDVSNGLTLYRENDDGKIETVTLSKEDVLLAGITNKVTLQYGPFFPSYTVFFSNGEKLNKYGRLDKVNNTIDYTVSLNLQDSTVWEYLLDVGNQGAPITSAAFYDDYADGWDYVNGTLTATIYGKNGEVIVYPYTPGVGDYYTRGSITEDDFSDGDIKAYLWNFGWNHGGDDQNLLCWAFNNAYTLSVDRLEFTYTLKASDAWLQEHAYGDEDTNVHNAAQILDDVMTHWDAEANVPYFPNRLNKTAKQDGTSNLITFTLDINSVGADLDPAKDYLIVTDDSTGIQIRPDSIKVTDKDGNSLTGIGDTTIDAELEPNEWGLLATEDEHQYKLKIPDGVALQITYDALVTEMGDAVPVSNKASIDGVTRSNSKYEGSLKVDEIHASGGGDEYQLTIVKVDRDNNSKKLPNAKFELYAVQPEGGTPSGEQYKEKITIGETTYQCQLKQELITGADGSVPVDSKNLEPGRYYILKEIEAPTGYELLEEPILFYFGLKNDDIDPTVAIAPPDGMLTVGDPPVQYELPESGGIGTTKPYTVGALLALMAVGILVYTTQKRRKEGN